MNRINIPCLGVRDIKKSLEFYRNIGFKTYEKADAPSIVFFDNQGTKLELYPIEELAKDINAATPPSLQTGFCGVTLACTMKSKEEVDAVMDAVQRHGGTIAKQPQEVFWGGYSPVLDIKPYTPSLDRSMAAVVPAWCSHWPKNLEQSASFDWGYELNT